RRLRELEEPIAELVPHEAIERVRRVVEAELGDPFRHGFDGRREPREEPPRREERRLRWLSAHLRALDVGKAETRRVPNLVAEVSIAFDLLRRERDALGLRRVARERDAERIRTERGEPLG